MQTTTMSELVADFTAKLDSLAVDRVFKDFVLSAYVATADKFPDIAPGFYSMTPVEESLELYAKSFKDGPQELEAHLHDGNMLSVMQLLTADLRVGEITHLLYLLENCLMTADTDELAKEIYQYYLVFSFMLLQMSVLGGVPEHRKTDKIVSIYAKQYDANIDHLWEGLLNGLDYAAGIIEETYINTVNNSLNNALAIIDEEDAANDAQVSTALRKYFLTSYPVASPSKSDGFSTYSAYVLAKDLDDAIKITDKRNLGEEIASLDGVDLRSDIAFNRPSVIFTRMNERELVVDRLSDAKKLLHFVCFLLHLNECKGLVNPDMFSDVGIVHQLVHATTLGSADLNGEFYLLGDVFKELESNHPELFLTPEELASINGD
jgi:flagellin-specific chaperone FliS